MPTRTAHESGRRDEAFMDEWIRPVDRELFEQLADAVTVIDRDWCYRYVSSGAAALIGRPAHELVGAYVWDVFPEVVGTPEYDASLRAMDERVAVRIVVRHPESGHALSQHAIPVEPGLVVVADDVTERELAATRSQWLVEVGEVLAGTISFAEVQKAVSTHVFPLVGAAFGSLILADPAGEVMRSLGWSGLDAGVADRWAEYPMTLRAPSVEAYRTGGTVLLDGSECSPGRLRDRYPDVADDLARLGLSALIVLPLQSGGDRLGALALGFRDRVLTVADREFLTTVAAMCAQALVRARLFDVEKRSIDALQRSLLPAIVHEVDGLEVAVRYASSEAGVEIGGDWYDVVPLSGGSVALVMGDVEGHDLAAAALMGLVRSAVRSYALDDHPPAVVMARTNRFLQTLHQHRLVTVAYLHLHPAERLVTAVSAGHPAALTCEPDGTVGTVATETGPPLGVLPEGLHWPETTTLLAPGSAVAMFTDGLVERRDADFDEGVDAVRAALHGNAGRDVDRLADALLRARTTGFTDDVALLVARVTAGAPDMRTRDVSRRLPPTPASVTLARRFSRQLLESWGVPADVRGDVEVVVSELVTNAARHSDDVIAIRLLLRDDDVLRLEVQDPSHRLPRGDLGPPDADATAGRGLLLVATLSTRWGIDSEGLGKTVWCEFALRGPGRPVG